MYELPLDFDLLDPIAQPRYSMTVHDLAKRFVEETTIHVQGAEVDVIGRPAQPLSWNIFLLRPVPELQNNVTFAGSEVLLEQMLHRQSKLPQ